MKSFATSLLPTSLVFAALAPAAMASPDNKAHQSAYAGEETREIKSLSSEDIAELRRGGGWGLAKAAELNGIPGPAHVLELSEAIALTAEQKTQVTAIYDEMRSRAIEQGRSLISLEADLERRFQDRTITTKSLQSLLNDIAAKKSELRFTHLSTHIALTPILSKAQVEKYNMLRGYAEDPCASVPEGHNAEQWRRHNSCE